MKNCKKCSTVRVKKRIFAIFIFFQHDNIVEKSQNVSFELATVLTGNENMLKTFCFYGSPFPRRYVMWPFTKVGMCNISLSLSLSLSHALTLTLSHTHINLLLFCSKTQTLKQVNSHTHMHTQPSSSTLTHLCPHTHRCAYILPHSLAHSHTHTHTHTLVLSHMHTHTHSCSLTHAHSLAQTEEKEMMHSDAVLRENTRLYLEMRWGDSFFGCKISKPSRVLPTLDGCCLRYQ